MTHYHSKAIRIALAKEMPWTPIGGGRIVRADTGGLLKSPWFRLIALNQLVEYFDARFQDVGAGVTHIYTQQGTIVSW